MRRIMLAPLIVGLTAATLVASALPAAAAPLTSQYQTSGAAAEARTEETPPGSLAAIQRTADLRITQRLASIEKTAIRVRSNTFLTDDDRATILATLDAGTTGLTALGDVIAADTDRATAAAHFTQIFTDYRVYAVVLPQSYYAAAADALSGSALPTLEKAYSGLSAALEASGTSTTELEAALADMRAQIDTATAAVAGVSASALAVSPADFNANHAVLADEKAAIATATAAARQAALDGKTLLGALR
jgi:hypothetical protein